MTRIIFHIKRGVPVSYFGTAEWPHVPRAGERITFDPDGRTHGSAVVEGVTWGSDGTPTVELHVYRAIDIDIKTLTTWGFVPAND